MAGVIINQGTTMGTCFGQFPWESRLLLQDIDVQSAAGPLGSAVCQGGWGCDKVTSQLQELMLTASGRLEMQCLVEMLLKMMAK